MTAKDQSLVEFAGGVRGAVPCVVCTATPAIRTEAEAGRLEGISLNSISKWLRGVKHIELATESRVDRHFRDHVA